MILYMYYVYLLLCSDNSTYVGATVNLDKRIRQHNKEIKGGARYTTNKVCDGHYWTIYCYLSGFPDWNNALMFEWRWKQITRKMSSKKPIDRRIHALEHLMSLEKPTSKSIPFNEYKLIKYEI